MLRNPVDDENNLSRPFDSNLADVSYHMFYITEFYSKRMHKYILEHKLLSAIINGEPEANCLFISSSFLIDISAQVQICHSWSPNR